MSFSSKEQLFALRNKELSSYPKQDMLFELEKVYGKYLFVPFDIPRIEPKDRNEFIRFFFRNASATEKKKNDIAPGNPGNNSPYYSINGTPVSNNSTWSGNYVPEIKNMFPEIFEQMFEYLPIQPDIAWKLWSSKMPIVEHRDQYSMIDIPSAFRIKLFDSNPEETLHIRDAIPGKESSESSPLHLPKQTNCFAWNNLRTTHYSTFNPDYRKILLIFPLFEGLRVVNINKYIVLMDKSVAKYAKNCITSANKLESYVGE